MKKSVQLFGSSLKLVVLVVVAFSFINGISAQPFYVKGNVSEAGNSLASIPGVNIIIKGTNDGTISDLDGNYELQVPSQDAILIRSVPPGPK